MVRPLSLASLAWVVLAAGLCAGLFLVKQQVRGLEARLVQLNESILDDQQAIHVLRAEWSYLNQPSRLDDLGRRLLRLEPRRGQNITSIQALGAQRRAKPPVSHAPRPDLDAHTAPLVSPGYATPISARPNPDTRRSNEGAWVRAILTEWDDRQ